MPYIPSILIPALWIAWLVYWWIESLSAHAVQRQESVSSRLSHTLPLLIGATLMISHRWPAWLSERALPRSELAAWVGVLILAAGIAFSIWARRHIAGWWSSTVTLKRDHQLIRTGPYRWVRHPIYTGLLLGVLGSAIAAGQWGSFIGAGFIAMALLRKIAIEERFLREAFPGDYDRYRSEVAALVPFIY